jgi:hypothetical protein
MSSGPLPVQQVRTMQTQGMDSNQIIQALQRDGFNATQIFDAMNQATMGASTPAVLPPQKPRGESMNEQGYYPPPKPASSQPTELFGGHSTEEMVESIIDEKWNELVKDITTIIEWKNQTQITIVTMEQQFRDLKDQFDKLHQALIAKIGEYDKNILDVGAEVKAMEKVFSKVLPVFTQNVAELSQITKNMQNLRGKEGQ